MKTRQLRLTKQGGLTTFNPETASDDELFRVILIGKIYELLSNDDNYLTLGALLSSKTTDELKEIYKKLF